MKESRLLEGQATDFEASLLRAAAMESPTEEQSARMLAPIGLGGAATGATGSGGVSGTAAGGSGTGAGMSTGSALTAKLWFGGVGLAVGLGAVVVSLTSGPPPDQTAETAPSVPAGDVAEAETAEAPGTNEAVTLEALPTEEPKQEAGAKPTRSRSPAVSSADTLAAEMQLLDQARSALATDPARALTLLEAYEARFPKGVLRPEATVLRVDALERSGSSKAANELRGEFLEDNPTSAHKNRLQGPTGSAP